MELDNITWRDLKSIYLTIPVIRKSVNGWFDGGSSSEKAIYITSYGARYFLRRLVVRAYKDLQWDRKVLSVVLDSASESTGWTGKTAYQEASDYLFRNVGSQVRCSCDTSKCHLCIALEMFS